MNVKKCRSKVSLLTHVCLMQSQVSLCWWFLKSHVQPQSISLLEMQIVKPLPRHTQLEAVEALRWLPRTLKFENNCFSLHLPLHSKTPHLLSYLKSYASSWADSNWSIKNINSHSSSLFLLLLFPNSWFYQKQNGGGKEKQEYVRILPCTDRKSKATFFRCW